MGAAAKIAGTGEVAAAGAGESGNDRGWAALSRSLDLLAAWGVAFAVSRAEVAAAGRGGAATAEWLPSTPGREVPVVDLADPEPRVADEDTVGESESSAAAIPAACGPANDMPNTNAAAPTRAPRLFIGMKDDRLRCL